MPAIITIYNTVLPFWKKKFFKHIYMHEQMMLYY